MQVVSSVLNRDLLCAVFLQLLDDFKLDTVLLLFICKIGVMF